MKKSLSKCSNIITSITRVNFRGVITPVLGFFYVFTPFLRGWGVALGLKLEVRRVAVYASVKKVVRNNG